MTNQKATGRCWMFASLNAMRIAFIKSKNIEDFEFSQNYLFFWDKVSAAMTYLLRFLEFYFTLKIKN